MRVWYNEINSLWLFRLITLSFTAILIHPRSKPIKSMASNTYSQGAQVEHQKFGLGSVVSHTEERIVIKFDDHGEKKFVTNLVIGSLKKSDRQPPAEKKGARRKKAAAPVTA